jgi:protease II
MFTNAMAVVHLLQTVVDVYLWLQDEIADHQLMERIQARKKARAKYIATEKQRIRLEILREMDRNNPKPVRTE